ncbi:helix-turn-helix domain-containing protein [Mucilaginibacter sp. RS28]|uniref:Helix-turn-helix domain-containing protein n=1 Tax=Mucilaginibacter straminoryzae TaxID=2932774 RepID=A0A9X1WYM5_9SPHI|nr:helix-turn-helix domain-containing protein [Mucilaginibacter straminoryzae]MCJ8208077.1 helix-turn-helix domain-containing protein [Mucilaginibacter straminoryzae]
MKNTETIANNQKLQQPPVTADDLDIFRVELLAEIKKLIDKHAGYPGRRWLKTEEVKKLLGASTGTLTTLRINGTLPYSRIGGILYYDAQDIENMLLSRKIQHR